jgi:hypothetical protein
MTTNPCRSKSSRAQPPNGTAEIAGPEQIPLDALARQYFDAKADQRLVIADIHAR